MAIVTTLKIDGMHCDACVRRVRTALGNVTGVQVKDVKVGSAEIELERSQATVEDAVHAINDIGFEAHAS